METTRGGGKSELVRATSKKSKDDTKSEVVRATSEQSKDFKQKWKIQNQVTKKPIDVRSNDLPLSKRPLVNYIAWIAY